MADDTKPPSEEETKTKFKGWVSEVLDEREAKAKADREAAEKADKEKRRTNRKPTFLESFLGFGGPAAGDDD